MHWDTSESVLWRWWGSTQSRFTNTQEHSSYTWTETPLRASCGDGGVLHSHALQIHMNTARIHELRHLWERPVEMVGFYTVTLYKHTRTQLVYMNRDTSESVLWRWWGSTKMHSSSRKGTKTYNHWVGEKWGFRESEVQWRRLFVSHNTYRVVQKDLPISSGHISTKPDVEDLRIFQHQTAIIIAHLSFHSFNSIIRQVVANKTERGVTWDENAKQVKVCRKTVHNARKQLQESGTTSGKSIPGRTRTVPTETIIFSTKKKV